MKKLILFVLLALFGTVCLAQNNTRVVLKNNVSITGKLKEFNPTSHIVLTVSGIDSRIEMSEVERIESLDIEKTDEQVKHVASVSLDDIPADVLARENHSFPETYTLDFDGVQIEMILIKGGVFSMGYDGPGSMRMNSEPIHNVYVSSFYISKSSLKDSDVAFLKGKAKKNKNGKDKPFKTINWSTAAEVVSLASDKAGMALRLPSEAEWEYIVSDINRARRLDFQTEEIDYCCDFAAEYPSSRKIVVNPLGPEKGFTHIIRFYGESPDVYCTREDQQARNNKGSYFAQVRLVIRACDLIQSIQ